ncbi:unnamed protein product [Closterium sp. NIES-53]
MALGQQASAVDVVVEGAEDEEEEGLEVATTMEAVEVAAMAMTTRTTDAVMDGSMASVFFAISADTCGAIAKNSLMDGLLLKAKRLEEQGEGQEEAVEAMAVAEVVLQAMFKGPDGKMVGVKNVLWVPNLAANLISVRRLQKASMDTSSKGTKTYTARIGKWILWDLHEERDVYNKMWQISVATGECDWLTLHRRMGHLVLPILQQLVKGEMVAGIRVKGEPTEVLGCPTCMQAKFTRFPFSSSKATAKAPLDEVVMDVVGPLKLGAAGAEYFLTIVDVYTRMTWVYVLFKKSDVAETVKTDWLPMVERQQDWLLKSNRTVRGGEFLSKEFGLWLKKNGTVHSLTMPYSPAMNGIAERANHTITETARGLLIEVVQADYC